MIEPKTIDSIKITHTELIFPTAGQKQKVVIYAPSEEGRLIITGIGNAPSWLSFPTEVIDDGRMCKAIITVSAGNNSTKADRTSAFSISVLNDKGTASFSLTVTQIGESGVSIYLSDSLILAGSKEQEYSIKLAAGGPIRIDSVSSSNFNMGTARYDGPSSTLTVKPRNLQSDLVAQRIYYALVNFTIVPTSRSYQLEIPVIQSTVRRRPIWCDDNLSITGGKTYYDVKIQTFDHRGILFTVYEGRIYRFPGEDTVYFNPSRIMENYVQRTLDFNKVADITIDRDYGKLAYIYIDDKILGTYSFFYDWSYEPINYFGKSDTKPLTVPVRKNAPIDLRQTFVSSLGTTLGDVWYYNSLRWTDGSIDEWGDVVWNDCTPTQLRGSNPAAQDRIIRPSDYPGIQQIEIDRNMVLDVRKTCADYCLHYLNKFGGYDSILVNGNVDQDDQIHPHSFIKKPAHSGDFEETRYLVENRRKYTVNINWLTKDECSRMDQLLESPQVWIEDLKTNEIVPVVLQNQEMSFNRNKKVRNYKLIYLASETRRRK